LSSRPLFFFKNNNKEQNVHPTRCPSDSFRFIYFVPTTHLHFIHPSHFFTHPILFFSFLFFSFPPTFLFGGDYITFGLGSPSLTHSLTHPLTHTQPSHRHSSTHTLSSSTLSHRPMSAESIDSSALTSTDNNNNTHSHQNRPRKHSADSRNRREVIALDGQMFESAPAQEDSSAVVLHPQVLQLIQLLPLSTAYPSLLYFLSPLSPSLSCCCSITAPCLLSPWTGRMLHSFNPTFFARSAIPPTRKAMRQVGSTLQIHCHPFAPSRGIPSQPYDQPTDHPPGRPARLTS
jgi:hypothetical protein